MHTEPIEFNKQYMDTTVGRVILNDTLPEDMPFINGLLKKKGLAQLVQYCYLRFGLQTTVADARRREGARLPATPPGPASRSASTTWSCPQQKATLVKDAEKRSHRGAEAVPGRRHHQRRALQQDHRNLVEGHREGLRRDVQGDGRGRPDRPLPQPDLHHGRLRRPRIETADPPALRYARPDGQALGRNHRDPDHGELPRRPERAAVLHLDARRPQGSGRHGAEDGRLGLPDAPSGGRGAGRHHHRERLRHRRTASTSSRSSNRAKSSSRCATASSAAWRSKISATTKAT